jgi:hypothetical protein
MLYLHFQGQTILEDLLILGEITSLLKIQGSWYVTPCQLLNINQSFEGIAWG